MLTRGQVAKRIGKSIATVRRMEGHQLHPVRDARGVMQFRAEEVARVLRQPNRPMRRSDWFADVVARHGDEAEPQGNSARAIPAQTAAPEPARLDEDAVRRAVGEAVRDELARRQRDENARRLAQQEAEGQQLARDRAQLLAERLELVAFVDECSEKDRRRLFNDPEFLAIYDVVFGGD